MGWERNVFENLRCRLAATLSQQRLVGNIDNAYQAPFLTPDSSPGILTSIYSDYNDSPLKC
jgi:hypothetical protein